MIIRILTNLKMNNNSSESYNTKTNSKSYRTILKGGGVRVRSLHQFYRAAAKKSYFCNNCNTNNLIRERAGLWKCKRCNTHYSGAAYTPI